MGETATEIDVVYLAGNGDIGDHFFTNGEWRDFTNLGPVPGGSTNNVAVSANGNLDGVYAVVRSADNKFSSRTWNSTVWGEWIPVQSGGNALPQPQPGLFIAEPP
ncbi:MAG: hypothetical protein NTZ05_00255, partial [Chloroflexi bacterium]|nr:hypothetical protein [Chloroflexota bacterium]